MYANLKANAPVKVVDFGLSTRASHGDATMKVGPLLDPRVNRFVYGDAKTSLGIRVVGVYG